MLKFRVIPIVLVDGPNVVKGSGFDNWRRIGTLAPVLNVYNTRDVDELILLDTRASRTGQGFNRRILEQALGRISVPLSVGGGVGSVEDVADLIDGGADKVIIGSALASDTRILEHSSSRFGAQALIATIDVRSTPEGRQVCCAFGASKVIPGSPFELAQRYESAGAGEIMINSITRDGTMSGFDLAVVDEVANAVSIPVIGAGGAGSPSDFVDLATSTSASAGAAGSLFSFTEVTPQDVRDSLSAAAIPVRRVRRGA
jgi:cyclase